MKNLVNVLIVLAAVSVVVWIICRFTGLLLPSDIGVKGISTFTAILLLFAIAISVKDIIKEK